MTKLHKKGIISDQILALYGISGKLPDPEEYSEMSREDKKQFWCERMENRLGPKWKDRFRNRLFFDQQFVNWKIEGF